MSIADKLITIAENEPKVFRAGKLSVLKDSQYMNATADGKAIAVGDVSPVEHEVSVQLESVSLADFSSVTVKRYGKNLFENNTDELAEVSFIGSNGETRIRGGYAISLPAGTYTTHAEPIVEYTGGYFVYHSVNTVSGKVINISNSNFNDPIVNETCNNATFTIDEEFTYFVFDASGNVNLNRTKKIFESFHFQLEVGDTATPYEPYSEPTAHTASADGTVSGVRSISPSMTLVTDTDGVVIHCSYLRDIDTYIDNLMVDVALTGGE